MKPEDINLVDLTNLIVKQYSYEELHDSAYFGTLSYLETLDPDELLEEADIAGYEVKNES